MSGPAPKADDVAQLRSELAALKKETTGLLEVVRERMEQNTTPTKLTLISDLKNVGRATPDKAAETIIWAAAGGDTSTVAQSIALAKGGRQKLEDLLGRLPEATRNQYGTPENLAALMLSRDVATVSGMQVLGQRELGANDSVVRIRVGNDEGKTKDQTLVAHRADDGWKLSIPDESIERWIRQLSGGK